MTNLSISPEKFKDEWQIQKESRFKLLKGIVSQDKSELPVPDKLLKSLEFRRVKQNKKTAVHYQTSRSEYSN
jgi:hypothetical protein